MDYLAAAKLKDEIAALLGQVVYRIALSDSELRRKLGTNHDKFSALLAKLKSGSAGDTADFESNHVDRRRPPRYCSHDILQI